MPSRHHENCRGVYIVDEIRSTTLEYKKPSTQLNYTSTGLRLVQIHSRQPTASKSNSPESQCESFPHLIPPILLLLLDGLSRTTPSGSKGGDVTKRSDFRFASLLFRFLPLNSVHHLNFIIISSLKMIQIELETFSINFHYTSSRREKWTHSRVFHHC